jgi:hypothetical protein
MTAEVMEREAPVVGLAAQHVGELLTGSEVVTPPLLSELIASNALALVVRYYNDKDFGKERFATALDAVTVSYESDEPWVLPQEPLDTTIQLDQIALDRQYRAGLSRERYLDAIAAHSTTFTSGAWDLSEPPETIPAQLEIATQPEESSTDSDVITTITDLGPFEAIHEVVATRPQVTEIAASEVELPVVPRAEEELPAPVEPGSVWDPAVPSSPIRKTTLRKKLTDKLLRRNRQAPSTQTTSSSDIHPYTEEDFWGTPAEPVEQPTGHNANEQPSPDVWSDEVPVTAAVTTTISEHPGSAQEAQQVDAEPEEVEVDWWTSAVENTGNRNPRSFRERLRGRTAKTVSTIGGAAVVLHIAASQLETTPKEGRAMAAQAGSLALTGAAGLATRNRANQYRGRHARDTIQRWRKDWGELFLAMSLSDEAWAERSDQQ